VSRKRARRYLNFFYKTIHRTRSEKGNLGSAGIFTLGARLAGKLPASFDYGIETAGQTGDVASDPLHAWAGHWLLGYTAGSLKTTPRFLVEYNYASGDRSTSDGKRGTFDQLYPTNHYKYGAIDLLGWRNLRSMRAGSEMKVRPRLTVSLSYLSHWLAQASDAFYNGSGAPVFRLPPGASGRHVGHEFDLVFLGALSKQYSLGLGYARLWAGSFLKQAAGGSDFSYPYAFLAYNF